MILSDCLRSDSIFKADSCDLYDLCDFCYHQRSKQSAYQILIMRIVEDKTVHDKNIFVRVMRHADVRRCAMGTLDLWLLDRLKKMR